MGLAGGYDSLLSETIAMKRRQKYWKRSEGKKGIN